MQMENVKKGVKGFIGSVLTGVVLLFLIGYICYKGEDMTKYIGLLGKVILFASAFLGGVIACFGKKEFSLLPSLISGLFFMLFILIISFMLKDSGEKIGFYNWIMYLAIPLASIIGGIVFGRTSKKKKRKHNKRK